MLRGENDGSHSWVDRRAPDSSEQLPVTLTKHNLEFISISMVLVTPSPDGGEIAPDGTKKKKLTSLEKSDGRRLVEYLVVVSSIPREEDENEAGQEMNLSTSFDDEEVEVLHGFKPQITARYPLFDHEDNPLHENVTFFCHPSGTIQLKKESYMPKVSERLYLCPSPT